MIFWIIAFVISFVFLFLPPDAKRKVVIGKSLFLCSEARSIFSRALGLMFRGKMDKDKGIIFRFSRPMRPPFTSVGMKFPIDIIWFRDKKVSEITEDVSVASGKSVVTPESEADGCIEIVAGEAKIRAIAVHDTISIS